jgi:hypothetical protein
MSPNDLRYIVLSLSFALSRLRPGSDWRPVDLIAKRSDRGGRASLCKILLAQKLSQVLGIESNKIGIQLVGKSLNHRIQEQDTVRARILKNQMRLLGRWFSCVLCRRQSQTRFD